ncbi:hypothetical protein [Brevundimonas sp. Root1279]|uniref:hypothetical protein n=1 Tax=Brevundimonas sp. Root1279 TaxID=1736443 RepID=UPI00070009A7|nr:hypothetical protein [Brevundimonas sp. Root1279]KQW82526.1 hypothetical protein ASC65_09895 [Brevundimonas sp. Root1279]
MKRFTVAALAALLFATPVAAQSLDERMAHFDRAAESAGFGFAAGPFNGSLDNDETTRFGFPIVPGADFSVVAVCDGDCSDLDLRAYDASGRLVVENVQIDALPEVVISTTENEIAFIEVVMANCSQAPCYWQAKAFFKNSVENAGGK